MDKKLNYNVGDIVTHGLSCGVVDEVSPDDGSFSVHWYVIVGNPKCAWFFQIESEYLKKVGSIKDYIKSLRI